MRTGAKALTAVAATVALGAGGFAFERGGEHHAGASDPITALAADVTPQNLAAAEQICSVQPYNYQDYKTHAGPNMLATVGSQTNASGHAEFASIDPNATAQRVAAVVAPNTLGIATINTILTSETGISVEKVAREAGELNSQMEANQNLRKKTCAAVIGRILQTPKRFVFRSETGKVTEFKPLYDDAQGKVGIDAISKANDASIDAFGITAVVGSPNEDLEKSVSNVWGVSAEGQIVKMTEEEGEVKVDDHGNPVKASQNSSTTAKAGSTNNTSGGNQNGNNQGNQGTGGSAGPNGPNPEAGPGGSTNSPANGGNSGNGGETGTTTGTTPNTGTTPGSTVPKTTTSTTPKTTTTTTPKTTTTTVPTTKGTDPSNG